MKIIGITQARISSSRLPKKVLLTIKGKTLLEYHLERATKSQLVNKWIVATTNEKESDTICAIARKLMISCYKGSLEDVLDRFYNAAKKENADYVVRITSDCPLNDGALIDEIVRFFFDNKLNYYYNRSHGVYPDGLDIEVFSFEVLENAWKNAKEKPDREHVTSYIRNNLQNKKIDTPEIGKAYARLRITVDHDSDFQVVKHLIENFGSDKPWKVYADYLIDNPSIQKVNNPV